jgi:hypothetical protein
MLFKDIQDDEIFLPQPKLRNDCIRNKNINFEYIHRGFFVNSHKNNNFYETSHFDFFDDHINFYPLIQSTFSITNLLTFCTKYCYNFYNLFKFRKLTISKDSFIIPEISSEYNLLKFDLDSELRFDHDSCEHRLLILNSIISHKVFINITSFSYSCTKCNLCKRKQGIFILNGYIFNSPIIICTSCLNIFADRTKNNINIENLFA